MTVRPDFAKWNQNAEDIRRLSIEADHARSRERYQALYQVGSQQCNSSEWAKATGRQKQTVLQWLHSYNEQGPDSLIYQYTGGRQPKLNEAEKKGSLKRSERASR